MSMGQQLGAKPGATAGMTPSAGSKTLPGQTPGRPPANQLQQAMMPTTAGGATPPAAPPPLMGNLMSGMGPVAPQAAPQQNIAYENRATNQRGMMGVNQQAPGAIGPVAPQGMGSITGLTQNTAAQQAQIQQRNVMRQARGARG